MKGIGAHHLDPCPLLMVMILNTGWDDHHNDVIGGDCDDDDGDEDDVYDDGYDNDDGVSLGNDEYGNLPGNR